MKSYEMIEKHGVIPFVSVIVVNWNGVDHLSDCLESLSEQTYQEFEVIVVDNGSDDDSVCLIKKRFPWVKLVCLENNLGFTGGNLAGYRIAQGSFIALLNNDTRSDKSWLENSISAISTDSDNGICACTILIEGTDKIDSVGDIFTTAFSGTKVGYLKPIADFNQPHQIFGGCAAAILYRRSMLEAIGFLDDDFFFNHEDTDLNIRAWLCGWKCVYSPNAIVYHKVSATVGELSSMAVYYFSRNSLWVWLKNVPLGLMVRYLPQRMIYELCSALYFCSKGQAISFLRGKLDALKKLPSLLEKRRNIQLMVKLSSDEISKNLLPLSIYLKSRLNKAG